jgi:hypothetical protein
MKNTAEVNQNHKIHNNTNMNPQVTTNANKLVNYSFAQNEMPPHESPADSFAQTKQELKQIMENHVAE